jgi:GNAT superfamily N-acetyltransferase
VAHGVTMELDWPATIHLIRLGVGLLVAVVLGALVAITARLALDPDEPALRWIIERIRTRRSAQAAQPPLNPSATAADSRGESVLAHAEHSPSTPEWLDRLLSGAVPGGAPTSGDPQLHMIDLARSVELLDGHIVTIRPMRPEDAAIERDFVRDLSQQSRYLRFMVALNELTPEMLWRFTHVDQAREMALIAVHDTPPREHQVGVARYATLSDGQTCEFAVVVADGWQARGLAHELMHSLIDAARDRGLAIMEGVRLRQNLQMRDLASSLGFESSVDPADPTLVRMRLVLQRTGAAEKRSPRLAVEHLVDFEAG